MEKALTQMNIQLANVISDLTGQSGLAIVDAILAGERDPQKLASLRNYRIKADVQTIAKSLVGDWLPEHLFALRQARQRYAHYQQMIAECDLEVADFLRGFQSRLEASAEQTLPVPKTPAARSRPHEPQFDLRGELHRILGVDLTQVPGIQCLTASIFLSEVGPSVEPFATPQHFSSWLGLCPDNRITGRRILSAATREVKSRTAYALRMAALTLQRSQSSLGEHFRRMKARLGTPAAITATANKLARILYHLVKHRCAYDASVFAAEEELHRRRRENNLRKQAAHFGFQLTPLKPWGRLFLRSRGREPPEKRPTTTPRRGGRFFCAGDFHAALASSKCNNEPLGKPWARVVSNPAFYIQRSLPRTGLASRQFTGPDAVPDDGGARPGLAAAARVRHFFL